MDVSTIRVGYSCETCSLESSIVIDNRGTDDDWDAWYADMLVSIHSDHLSSTPDCDGEETSLKIGMNPDG